MSVQIKDLALKLGISQADLKAKIQDLGFELSKTTKEIDDEIAELIENEFKTEGDKASEYGNIIDKQLDREIIKTQRKKTAGREKFEKKREWPREALSTIKEGTIEIPDVISVKEFSEKTGVNAAKIIGELMKNGILANINQSIDFDTAQIIADDLGLQIKKKRSIAALEDVMTGNLEALLKEDDPNDLKPRPPIISIIGHIDHGKTRLLDAIRNTNVMDTEAGGITQHIGAYQIERNGKKITFLDTPGHEAFTSMRARGAKATDIAILVVAADEGIKPQTIEAISHAREAGIPIVVAITKIDKEGSQIERVKGQLVEYDLQPEDWGGKTVIAPVSALKGQGIQELLDMVLLVAEMEDLRANPSRPAVASVIEADLDPSLGPVATILINTGTLQVMDNVVCGTTYGRMKVMVDDKGKRIKKALPSDAVRIAGLSETPHAGDILQAMPDEKAAKTQALAVKTAREANEMRSYSSLEKIVLQIKSGKLKTLKIVLKTDTKGSLEAIKQALSKIESTDVSLKIIHADVGDISEGDVMMVSAASGVVIGFHVDPNPQAKKMADKEGIKILTFKVIYELIDNVKNILSGMLEPETVITELGKMKVKQIFLHGRKELIIGCGITNGKVENRARFRIIRNDEKIGEGQIMSLQRGEENVKELKEGNDCGIKITFSTPPMEGDIFEVYKQEKKERIL